MSASLCIRATLFSMLVLGVGACTRQLKDYGTPSTAPSVTGQLTGPGAGSPQGGSIDRSRLRFVLRVGDRWDYRVRYTSRIDDGTGPVRTITLANVAGSEVIDVGSVQDNPGGREAGSLSGMPRWGWCARSIGPSYPRSTRRASSTARC